MPVQIDSTKDTEVKRFKNVHLSSDTKSKFIAWKQNFLRLGKLRGCLGFSSGESMFQLLTKIVYLSPEMGPDSADTVQAEARQSRDPAEKHWRDVRKISVYLNKTKDLGMVREGWQRNVPRDYRRRLHQKDSYRRSVSEVAKIVEGTVVNGSHTTQHCVTRSTSESVYVAVAQGAKTAFFTKGLIDFFEPKLVDEAIGF